MSSAPSPHASDRVVQKGVKLPRRSNYFLEDDIVWVKPEKLPFWPAEVIKAENGHTTFMCRLFFYPKEHVPCSDLRCVSSKMYYFDKLSSEEELQECVEARLQRKSHKVDSYEKDFIKAVRRANDLVRIILDPIKLKPFEIIGIGVVRSLMRTHISAPRQPQTGTFAPQPAVIALRPGLENAVRDLKGFDWIWVMFHFSYSSMASGAEDDSKESIEESSSHNKKDLKHKALPPLPEGWRTMVIPPRDTVLRGVFATRTPHRPNSIGLSCVRLVDVQGLDIHIADHDLLHGTPVIDIKPYIPFCDAHPDANAGWVTKLDAEGRGELITGVLQALLYIAITLCWTQRLMVSQANKTNK